MATAMDGTCTWGYAAKYPRRVLRAVITGAIAITIWGTMTGCGSAADTLPDAKSVTSTFGSVGLSDGLFYYPRSIAIAPNGKMFVDDRTGRIQRFSADGKFEKSWFTPDHAKGMPVGMCAAPDGRLFVADTHYNRILIYDQDGQLLRMFGEAGEGPGQLGLPTDIAIDKDGNIYIGQMTLIDRISKFNKDLNFIKDFGGPEAGEASLSRPTGLTIDKDNTLWVADAIHDRLVRFSLDGKLLAAFGSTGKSPGQFRYPYDTALLPDGSLVVAEFGNSRLQQIDKQGRSLRTWGSWGAKVGQIAAPWGVGVAGNKVYAVDSGNNRIQVIQW